MARGNGSRCLAMPLRRSDRRTRAGVEKSSVLPGRQNLEHEFDLALLKALQCWQSLMARWLDERDTEGMDWPDHFACAARKRLNELIAQSRA